MPAPLPPRRLPGRRVLLGLALAVALVTAFTVLWSVAAPRVPAARERMHGLALPGVR